MNKLLLTLILLTCIFTAPSYARKIIVNPDSDKIVHSRSSIRNYDDNLILDAIQQAATPNYIKNGDFVIPGYKGELFESYYKPLLKRDFRRELAGTAWAYPDYLALKAEYRRNVYEANVNAAKEQRQNKSINKIIKKYIREAADYYYRDTLKDPDKVFYAGYDIVIEELR